LEIHRIGMDAWSAGPVVIDREHLAAFGVHRDPVEDWVAILEDANRGPIYNQDRTALCGFRGLLSMRDSEPVASCGPKCRCKRNSTSQEQQPSS
jgi:hypothetical protein